MLQQCNHPNVVRYLGSHQGEDYLWVRSCPESPHEMAPVCLRIGNRGVLLLTKSGHGLVTFPSTNVLMVGRMLT
jgi:hypothetical protein